MLPCPSPHLCVVCTVKGMIYKNPTFLVPVSVPFPFPVLYSVNEPLLRFPIWFRRVSGFRAIVQPAGTPGNIYCLWSIQNGKRNTSRKYQFKLTKLNQQNYSREPFKFYSISLSLLSLFWVTCDTIFFTNDLFLLIPKKSKLKLSSVIWTFLCLT